MRARSPKILNFAHGQKCTIRIPGICNHNTETTVAAHGPDKNRAKGGKTDDYWIAFSCSDCHAALDLRNVSDWESHWLQGILETQKRLVEKGLLTFPVEKKREKKLSKKVERKSLYTG